MSTLVPENLSCIKSCNDLISNFELSQENRALLMSLLDGTQALDDHDHDDERLMSVIRSLEVEIDQCTMKGHDLFQENNQGVANLEHNGQSCDQSQTNLQSNNIELNWMEKETNVHEVDDMNFWDMETNNQEIDGVSKYCYGVCLEENNYNSIFEEEQYTQN